MPIKRATFFDNLITHQQTFDVSNSTSRKIDTLVTLGTPIRSDYTPNENNIGQHINVYSNHDQVQNKGGFTDKTIDYYLGSSTKRVEAGSAGRTVNDARVSNLDASNYANKRMTAHSQLWENENIWNKVIVPELRK